MWAQALSRRGLWTRVLSGNDITRPCIIAQLTMPRLWVGSDRLAEVAKSKQSDGYERPTQLRRRSNMAIYPKIETRRAKRRNERHTSTVVSVPSQADTQLSPMGVAWSTDALIACSLRMGSQEPSVRHGLIVLCCPRNGPETPSLVESKRRNRTGGVRIELG